MSGTGLYTAEEIYRLLPAVYRVRDAEQGGVLRELVDVLTDQVNVVAESLEQMYDDQFIETCAPWVAPYIGDLVGYRTLHGVVPQLASPRAEVANTIRYRRRKGTVSVLEQLAADVTGWPAHAVEFFELLATTQYMNHVRPQRAGDRRTCATPRGSSSPERSRPARSTPSRTPRRCAGSRRAPAATTSRTSASSSGACSRCGSARSPLVDADGSGLRFRFDPLGTDKPLFAQRAPSRRSRTSPSRSTCRCRCSAASRRRTSPSSTATGSSLLLETETATGVDPIPAARRPHLRPLGRPGRARHVGARAAAGRHARRRRSGARPRRLPRRARRRRDPARDVPLRLRARGRRRRLRPRAHRSRS